MGHLFPLCPRVLCTLFLVVRHPPDPLYILYACGNHLHLEELYQKYFSLKMLGAMGYCGLAGSKRIRTCEDNLDGKVVELFVLDFCFFLMLIIITTTLVVSLFWWIIPQGLYHLCILHDRILGLYHYYRSLSLTGSSNQDIIWTSVAQYNLKLLS